MGEGIAESEVRVFDQQPVLTIADRATDSFGQPYTRQQPRAARLYVTVKF